MSYVMSAKGVSCVTNIDRNASITYSDIDVYSWVIIGDNEAEATTDVGTNPIPSLFFELIPFINKQQFIQCAHMRLFYRVTKTTFKSSLMLPFM